MWDFWCKEWRWPDCFVNYFRFLSNYRSTKIPYSFTKLRNYVILTPDGVVHETHLFIRRPNPTLQLQNYVK